MTREIISRLLRAAEHYGERNPNLSALLRDAVAVLERDRLLEVLRGERDLLQREYDLIDHYLDAIREELQQTEDVISELESFYANRNDTPSDA